MNVTVMTRPMPRISQPAPMVFVVHSDGFVRSALAMLMREEGWDVQPFADAETFLMHLKHAGPACLIVETQLPGVDGLQLQSMLAEHRDVPIIFLAIDPNVRTIVRAMKAGAIEVLTQPVDEPLLLDAVRQALQRSATLRAQEAKRQALGCRYESLSPREREVMQHVVRGYLNKNIAADLGISEITVKVHRGQVMRKMQADSLADLVNMAATLRIDLPERADSYETSGAYPAPAIHCA